ncbi:probable serine incorporator isoform X2 [Zingiber officinale]|uniref:probable serine incorporator isoform X2 n=1 Tax=Zingiber officinale TaxID=94328 RepID=UPI001C4CDE7B|nr:probable serine incorporator isoform X2 [Zingiber officinale]
MESVGNIVEEIDRSCGDEQRLEGPSINQKSDIYSTKRKQSLEARYVYGCIFLITNILAWLFRDYGHKLPHRLLSKRVCGAEGKNCVDAGGVLRLSLGCFIFFSFMGVATWGVHKLQEVRNQWHSSWWASKCLIYLLSIMGPFIISENIIQLYGEIARIGAGQWISDLQPNKCGLFGLFLSTVFYTASFFGIIMMYYVYALDSTCIINIFIITWTTGLVTVIMIVSLHSKVNAGLLSSAIMGSYIVFLCWSAIHSEPAMEKCNKRKRTDRDDMMTILSFFIAIGAIVMATFSTGTDSNSFQLKKNEVQSADDAPYNYATFHFIFSIGSMYFAMLFINWQLNQPTKKWSIDVGWVSTWIKIANECLAASIYLWKLMYPLIMKGTAISHEEFVQNANNSV